MSTPTGLCPPPRSTSCARNQMTNDDPHVRERTQVNNLPPSRSKDFFWRALLGLLLFPVLLTPGTSAPTNPAPAVVTLHDFNFIGDLRGDRALFTLTVTARVAGSKGGSVELLSGAAALLEVSTPPRSRVRPETNR